MRKRNVILIIAALLMIMSLSGCYGTGEKLKMATSIGFMPYEYVEEDTLKGIDIDIGAYIAEGMKSELRIVNMSEEDAFEAVRKGKIDFVISSVSSDAKLGDGLVVSEPYSSTNQVIITRSGSDIKTKHSLIGRNVGYITKSPASSYFEGVSNINGFGYEKGSDAVRELLSGKLDAIVIESTIAEIYCAENSGIVILDTPYCKEEYVIVTSSDNPELTEAVAGYLSEMKESGLLLKIRSSYFLAE